MNTGHKLARAEDILKRTRAESALKREEEKNKRLRPIDKHYASSRTNSLLEVYEIGDSYQVAKFENTLPSGGKEILYQAFVDFKSTSHCAYTLEEAVLLAFAYKNDTKDMRAAQYAARVLNIKDE